MKTIFLEKSIQRVSLAFRAYDTFDGGSVIHSGVQVYLAGVVQKPILTREGYILYMNLPEGSYTVTASGRYYDFFDPLILDTSNFDPIEGVVELNMRPRTDYPFPDATTLLQGVVKDQDGNPVSGARVQLVNSTDYALTNSEGRYVFYFQPDYPEIDVSFTISASGYHEETVSATVTKGETVSLESTIVELSQYHVALISGFVRDSYGNPITQARVEIVGTGISTLTDATGNCLLAKNISGATEMVSLRINQDGYAQKSIDLLITEEQTTSFVATMNLQILTDTATLEVSVRSSYYHKVPNVFVEVIEKNRSGYTNQSQGEVTFYDNSIFSGGESVTIRLSKSGYVTRTENATLYPGHRTSVSYYIAPV